ncbi:MAG: hypothetical protein FVQ79_02530 [Planctomycetes bacterium]|nr:hypothetical protein [Planctomycetota bacterium]
MSSRLFCKSSSRKYPISLALRRETFFLAVTLFFVTDFFLEAAFFFTAFFFLAVFFAATFFFVVFFLAFLVTYEPFVTLKYPIYQADFRKIAIRYYTNIG